MQDRARRIINIAFWCWSPEPGLLFSKKGLGVLHRPTLSCSALPFDQVPKELVLQPPRFCCASPQGTRNPARSRTRTSSRAARNPENKRKDLRSRTTNAHTHARRSHQGRANARERGGWGRNQGPSGPVRGRARGGGAVSERAVSYPPCALTCLGAGPKMAGKRGFSFL